MYLLADFVPIYGCEEWMGLDLCCVLLRAPKAFGWVSLKKPREQRLSLSREIRLHWNWFLNNVSEHLLAISVVVRRAAAQHFVEQGS